MTTAPPLLLKTIKELVARGDRAKQRSEDFYIAAGQHLNNLKNNYTTNWAEWESLLKSRIGLSTGRASELMAIASGRTSQEKIRAADATRKSIARVQYISSGVLKNPTSSQSRCDEDDKLISTGNISAHNINPHNISTHNGPTPSSGPKNGGAHQLIDALVASSSNSREAAANLVISGPRQSQFTTTVKAVADFYVLLSRAGR
jgi:hypothetical protein